MPFFLNFTVGCDILGPEMTDKLLNLDMNVVRDIMAQLNANESKQPNRHSALRNPELDVDGYVQGIVADYNSRLPEGLGDSRAKLGLALKEIDTQISDLDTQIDNANKDLEQYESKAKDVKKKVESLLEQFLGMFPETQRDMVKEDFVNMEYLQRIFNRNMGIWDKMFRSSAKQHEFQERYKEIMGLLESIGLSSPVKMETAIIQNQNIKGINIRRLQSDLDKLRAEKKGIIECNKGNSQQYDNLSAKMHRAVALFLDAYENRHELRKLIPATLNMQGLNEPVSFFQTIKGISKVQLEKLLQHVGLKTGYGPDQYIVRETVTNMQEKCLELITPFYSSGNARTDITTLMKYLAEHGVVFEGVIAPATYYQINPQSANFTGKTSEDVVKMIQEKLNGKDVISRETFAMQYTTDENKGKYLFRGQTFITSNPMSSYATPTWRTGRTGIAYATSTPSYAVTYASDIMGGGEVSGKTMKSEGGIIVNGHAVGFVTVFKNSKRNVHVGDYDLERMSTNRDLKKYIVKDFWQTETIVSPYNNPVVERYMVVGDKMVRVDDKDDDWRAIMDSMAPDLQRTHITGVSDEYRTGQQDNHGRQFLDRIRKLQEQVEVDAEHKVKTYDIPVDVLEKMGFIQKSNQFAKGTQKLSQQMTFENSQQNVME